MSVIPQDAPYQLKADRKTLDNEHSQESGVSDFTPETPLSDTVQTEKPKGQPVQLTLF